MMWRDTVDLISVAETDTGDNVFQLSESSRTVFANKKSVNRDEFYKAIGASSGSIANDIRPTATFEIKSIEYDDEQKLRHNGKDYLVIRTYSRNDETIELVCQAYDDVQTNLARLRDTVEIWRYFFVENSMGERQPQEERLITVPALIEYRSGGTGGVDDVIETMNNVTVTIRYRDGITPDMFLKIAGARYDIRYVDDPLNRHQTLTIAAEKVIP